jgi:hypothetical protein
LYPRQPDQYLRHADSLHQCADGVQGHWIQCL